METKHTKEFEEILNTQPSFFTKWGILILIAVILIFFFVINHFLILKDYF